MKTNAPTKKRSAAGQAPQLDLLKPAIGAVGAPLPRLAYTIKETAKILGISYISVYRLIERGLLKCSTALPGRKLISHREIEGFISRTSV